MRLDRAHRAVSPDGTEIVGRIHGQGPPLVLVHGSLEDGDLCWDALLPYLREHFTCYLPSTRGRGLSGESGDLAPKRRMEDVVSFVDSIGTRVHLFGESDGGVLALGTAASTAAVSSVAAYEPTVFEVADEDLVASLEAIIPRLWTAVNTDDLSGAARMFSGLIANDAELATLSAAGYFHEAGRYMPVFLQELEQDASSDYSPTASSILSKTDVPVLLLHGSRSARRGWFTRGVRYVAEHVADPHISEIQGTGHFGVALNPEAIAAELLRFFRPAWSSG